MQHKLTDLFEYMTPTERKMLHDRVHPHAIDLARKIRDEGTSTPDEIRMAANCISILFVSRIPEGTNVSEDYLINLLRTLLLMGWSIKERYDNGQLSFQSYPSDETDGNYPTDPQDIPWE